MALSLAMEWSASLRTAADLSPNNHGFAMADWRASLNVRVTAADEWARIAVKAAASRQLTTIRPPPISPLTSAG